VIGRLVRRRSRDQRGQGLVEFSLFVPIVALILLGMLEFGFAFDQSLTLSYASREATRMGAALANGGGTLNTCPTITSAPWRAVDPQIVAAVQRVVSAPGSQVQLNRITEIRIFQAATDGTETAGKVNVWIYAPGDAANPTVDGVQLVFKPPATAGWRACDRSNALPAQSIGVSVRYSYPFVTPLGAVGGLFGGGLSLSERTIMALNPTDI
jgi:Flp pilus assembly protein TadG